MTELDLRELCECEDMLFQEESTSSSAHLSPTLVNSPDFQMELGKDVDMENPPAKKKVGRRTADATKMFSQLRTKNGKPLKKEYVRCQIIRGMKKCIRHIEKGVIPTKGIHEFNNKDEDRHRTWRCMEALVRQHPESFGGIASTCEGPATDGKVVRRRQRMDAPQFRSFNDEYCQHFYEPEAVRELHWLYMQLVYGSGSVDAELMCHKLTVRCCDSKLHSARCRNVWDDIRYYVTFTMIDQLNLKPFGPTQASEIETEGVEEITFDPDYLFAETDALPPLEAL